MPTTSRIVSPEQAAEHFGTSIKTIHHLIDTGKLPVYVLGPRVRRIDLDRAEQVLLQGAGAHDG